MIFLLSIISILFFDLIVSNAFRIGDVECAVDPQPTTYTQLKCNSQKCELVCSPDYEFPNGETQLDLTCVNKRNWVAKGYNNMPHCLPICNRACMNGGECVGPNQCYCQEDYSGDRCELKIQKCTDNIPMPMNTMGRCITSGVQSCKVTCIQGHKFPDDTLSADLKCYSGQWRMEPRHFEKCEPYCNPPCQNGGTCVAPNLCQCSQDYRGSLCQHRTDNCAPQKIGFNGPYKCTGDYEKMECSIFCPQGFNFTFNPSSKYTCKYSEGFYTPQNVPQCDYRGMNVQLVHA